jgi:hypothetical protein
MLSKKQHTRRMGSLWFGGVLVFVCVELAAAEWPKGSAVIGQRTRPVAGLWRVNFINGPRQNWNTKAAAARVAQHNALVTRCLRWLTTISQFDSTYCLLLTA